MRGVNHGGDKIWFKPGALADSTSGLARRTSATTLETAGFRGFAGLAQQNCKKALTRPNTVHIWPLTDAALPVFPAPVASVANTERTTGPRP